MARAEQREDVELGHLRGVRQLMQRLMPSGAPDQEGVVAHQRQVVGGITGIDLVGHRLGRYQLQRRLGEGTTALVYQATREGATDGAVALKVLDPALVVRRGFTERFQHDVRIISGVRHEAIVPVYEYGTSSGLTYVAMRLAPGGSLADRLSSGPIDPNHAWAILSRVADAVHTAHRQGVLHLDLKPSNVLFDDRGEAMLTDFGLARTNFGFAIGTPGYMSPEQALGDDSDPRADVYGLGILAFEMLTGTRLYSQSSLAELLVAAVESPAPLASERLPALPPDVDGVLGRALAKKPDRRHQSPLEFLWDLTRALTRTLASRPAAVDQVEITPNDYKGSFIPAGMPTLNGRHSDEERLYEQAEAQLMSLAETALSAAIVVDESSFIIGWNGLAAKTFGWPGDEIVGRTLATTIVPERYREAHERGFKKYLATGEGPVLGKVIEITAMHSDGREFPIDLRIAPAARSGRKALFVGFARDITQRKQAEQLQAAQAAVSEILLQSPPVEEAAAKSVEVLGSHLGWSVGACWMPDGDALHCRYIWKAEGMECSDFEDKARGCSLGKGSGLAGRAWEAGDGIWIDDILHEEDLALALPAVRGGLRSAVGLPIWRAGAVQGVIELYSGELRALDENLMGRLFDLCRKIGAGGPPSN